MMRINWQRRESFCVLFLKTSRDIDFLNIIDSLLYSNRPMQLDEFLLTLNL